MSFWPFNNSLNNNNVLSKFLDSIQDLSSITVQDIVKDPNLVQEIINELHNIKANFNKNGSFSFSQTNQDSNVSNTNADSISLNSSNNDNNNNNSNNKDSKGVKLIELLIQPQILGGFIELLEKSVDFFYEQSLKEEEKMHKAITEDKPTTDIEEIDEMDEAKEEVESSDETFRRSVQAAADILSIDMWIMSNRIIETPNIMNRLWSILKMTHLQENYPSVSYLVHILDQLLESNSIELLNFIRRQNELVDTFLAKIEVPAIMDFFFRVIQTDKPDSPTGILDTIGQQNVIQKLINILKPQPMQFDNTPYIPDHKQYFKQSSATDFLKALVTISSNAALAVVMETNIGPNQLTRELVSPDIVNTMIHDIMLVKVKDKDGKIQTNKHGINNCVSIIIELIRKNNSDYDLNCGSYSSMLQNADGSPGEVNSYVMFQWLKDFEQNPPGPRDPIYLGEMLELFSNNLKSFSDLLELEPIPPIEVTSNILGFTRFKTSELIAELLHCSNMILLNSKKIKKMIHIRDQIRSQQNKRLSKALNDKITFPESPNIHDVTSGLDDVSLDDVHFETHDHNKQHDYSNLLKTLDSIEDSEDEEPSISPENPFVCSERNEAIRQDPCVGDLFKIKLIDSNILLNIVDKFTKFEWNNFFHNVVFDLIQQIFNGKLNSYNSFLIVELFNQCDLTELIIKSYEADIEPRPGYMGHLILIGEEIVKFTSLYKPDLISPIIVEAVSSEKWSWFVNDILSKTREIYNVVLGAEDNDDNNDYGFDSSGYLDMENQPKKIILGDTSNHDEFIHDGEDEDEDMDEPKVADVEVGKMSPTGDLTKHKLAEDDDDDEDDQTPNENNYVDNLSGSSSDEDEDDEGNELRRVSKHNE
ncbi:uncharacterized protein KGF55_003394 [Candida pseudojiufengensis]|uniref:uncharacterized protein n=1 Tax=Candida pseudojiufengensis TaxID=497109 RepID=UPI0022253FEE|nr:uncharacterized protein KGF55_003394 [Candida pseudojiufengensis]KAI5962318.1 hypothetical protein KGF55_003394 [Candida pseudojiufengensis]